MWATDAYTAVRTHTDSRLPAGQWQVDGRMLAKMRGPRMSTACGVAPNGRLVVARQESAGARGAYRMPGMLCSVSDAANNPTVDMDAFIDKRKRQSQKEFEPVTVTGGMLGEVVSDSRTSTWNGTKITVSKLSLPNGTQAVFDSSKLKKTGMLRKDRPVKVYRSRSNGKGDGGYVDGWIFSDGATDVMIMPMRITPEQFDQT